MRYDYLPRGVPGSHVESGVAPRALWTAPANIGREPFWAYERGKVFLGGVGDTPIGVKDNRHLLTVAGTRAGKGVSSIIPNLLLYPGSVAVIDPKGENATITAERRGKGENIPEGGLSHAVYVIDPFRVADVPDEYRAGFDPFAALNPHDLNFIDDCGSIADALIVAPHSQTNSFWNGAARNVLRGFIAWVAAAEGIKHRNINELRRLLYLPPVMESEEEVSEDISDEDVMESFDDLLVDMITSDEVAYGVPAEAASMLAGMDPRERGSVMATIHQNITFLSSPPMAKTLSGLNRSPDLKRWKFGGVSIYLCLPARMMHLHSRFFRLFINLLLGAVEYDRREPSIPALMLLDEMHVLGHMSSLETAAGLMAGYGVRIWSIWQDLNQLEHLYGKRWETFMGNSGVLQFFGLNDHRTLEYVSRRLGQSSMLSVNRGVDHGGHATARGEISESRSIQGTPLLSPEEVSYFFSRQSGNQLLLFPGADPIFIDRWRYYDHPFFAEVQS